MAFFSGVIRSAVLAMDTGLNVILPYDRPAEQQREPCKALYLLHGLGDNCAAWTRYTAIERYAREKGIAVVMPEVQRSFYHDMIHGRDYFTYIADELPALCARLFGIGAAREDTYVAGLSMGGYGAMRCGLSHPERYAGCASFSGSVDLAQSIQDHLADEIRIREFQAVLGMGMALTADSDLFRLAERVSALPKALQPSLFVTCGTEDFLYPDNRRFRDHLAGLPLDFTYHEWPGDHVWPFWDESVRRLLDFWFPAVE